MSAPTIDAAPPVTTRPERPAGPAPVPRRVGRPTRNDVLDVLGAAIVAGSVAVLLFGRLASLSGLIGFVVVTWLLFAFTFAALVGRSHDRRTAIDKVMTVAMASAVVLVLLPLGAIVGYTVYGGRRALVHVNFYTRALPGPMAPLTQGGIVHAIVGTLWMIGIAVVVTVPLGVACAVYLSEVGGRLARIVRTVVEAMTALPSVIAGLFIFAALVLTFHQRNGLFAALALGIMMLPIIIRSSDVVLHLVPAGLREASASLGASRWRTTWHVVLPTARSGLVTAVILGTARGIGETSPVLLTAGYTTFLNTNPLHGPMVSLPLLVFELVRSGNNAYTARALGAAALLLLLVLVLFTVARLVGGQAPGHQSARAARRSVRASRRDVTRMTARDAQA